MKVQNFKPIGDHYGLLGLNADAPTFDVQCASLVYVEMARDLAREVTNITNGSHEKSAAIFCEVITFLLNTGLALMNEGFDESREAELYRIERNRRKAERAERAGRLAEAKQRGEK